MTHKEWIKLTPDQQRIKVAELCGWSGVVFKPMIYGEIDACRGRDPIHGWINEPVPDYLNDLNIMHAIEDTMPADKWQSYDDNLEAVVREGYLWNATAAQKAEAFVITMEPI